MLRSAAGVGKFEMLLSPEKKSIYAPGWHGSWSAISPTIHAQIFCLCTRCLAPVHQVLARLSDESLIQVHHTSITHLLSSSERHPSLISSGWTFHFFSTFFKPPTRMIFIKTETLQQKTALWSPPILFFLTPRRGKPPNDRGRALQPTAGNHFLIVVDNQTTLRATRMRVARLL